VAESGLSIQRDFRTVLFKFSCNLITICIVENIWICKCFKVLKVPVFWEPVYIINEVFIFCLVNLVDYFIFLVIPYRDVTLVVSCRQG